MNEEHLNPTDEQLETIIALEMKLEDFAPVSQFLGMVLLHDQVILIEPNGDIYLATSAKDGSRKSGTISLDLVKPMIRKFKNLKAFQ